MNHITTTREINESCFLFHCISIPFKRKCLTIWERSKLPLLWEQEHLPTHDRGNSGRTGKHWDWDRLFPPHDCIMQSNRRATLFPWSVFEGVEGHRFTGPSQSLPEVEPAAVWTSVVTNHIHFQPNANQGWNGPAPYPIPVWRLLWCSSEEGGIKPQPFLWGYLGIAGTNQSGLCRAD